MLVATERALLNPALAAAPPDAVAGLLTAASDWAEAYCKRRFALASYRTYLSGGGWPGQTIVLPNTPVASLDRLAYATEGVLTVTATGAQLARVSTVRATDGSTASLALTRTASGVTSTATATGLTLAALVAAVAAVAGWSASVAAGYELYPSADLRPGQGAATAVGAGASLAMYLERDGGRPPRLDDEAGLLYGHFPTGESNIRVDYTAGFAAVPDAVQEAVVRVAQLAWQGANRDGNLAMEQLGPYERQFAEGVPAAATDAQVRGWLGPWVSHSNLMAGR